MANIFKKIKTIDKVGNGPRAVKAGKPAPTDPVRLGLKPVLKANSDDMVDATDFQDPFGHEDDSDIGIPEIKIETAEGENTDQTDDAAPVIIDEITLDVTSADDSKSKDKANPLNIEDQPLNTLPINDKQDDIALADAELPKDDKPRFFLNETTGPDTSASLPIAATTKIATDKKLNLHPIHDIAAPKTPPAKQAHREPVKPEATAQSEPPVRPSDELPAFLSTPRRANIAPPSYKAPSWPYWVLGAIGFLWLIASAATAYGYFELGLDKLTAKPIHAFGFVGFVLVPACLLGLTALLLRRMNSLSQESQKLAYLNQQLLSPSEHSGQSAARLADDITQQMDRIEQRADQAFNRLTTVQTAFAQQIDSVTQALTASTQDQTKLDNQLRASKTAWTGSVKDTEKSLSELSKTLDRVFESFQTRVDTTQDKMGHLSEELGTEMERIGTSLNTQSDALHGQIQPLMEKAAKLQDQLSQQLIQHEDRLASLKSETTESLQHLDDLLDEQAKKLDNIGTQQDALKAGKIALNAAWEEEDNTAQDRMFRHISQIDTLNDRTDSLIKKIDQAAEQLTATVQKKQSLALRGTMKDEQLSLLPGLGAAKDMLPSLLTPEAEHSDAILSYDDIDTSEYPEPQYKNTDIPEPLASQRVFGGYNDPPKQNWFKRFGRRATDPIAPQNLVGAVSAAPAAPPPQPNLDLQIDMSTLREKLISIQLSPDALIDSGSAQDAARLRMSEGPFAMSRYMATHLGAAIDYLRGLLPDDPVLRRQVYDIAAAFPMREQLDEKSEDMLISIFETEAGREYLLCDAALNG